jgi:YfiR/HmsC-like
MVCHIRYKHDFSSVSGPLSKASLEASQKIVFRLVAVVFAGMLLAFQSNAQAMDEYAVKAAFLYNFAKFVDWPPEVFKTPKDPIVVCVLGRNPFGSSLEDVIRGKSIEGRAFVFRQVADVDQANACQILFIAAAEGKHFRSLYGISKPTGILTVGESEGFATGGGIVNLKLDAGRVRFEINVDAAEHAQLHISSKLLSLAQIVKTEKLR